MEVFNKHLQISADDVKNETSVEQLNQWKDALETRLKSINHSLNRREHVIDAPKIKDARFYTTTFLELINKRLKELKPKKNSYAKFLALFKDVAKRELDPETYDRIYNEAFEKSGRSK